MSVVDTSGVYDHGQTEEAVGKVLETVTSSGGLSKDDFFVISKFGYRSNEKKEISHSFDVEKMNESLETSLRRLDTPSLDSFLLHDPERQLINAYPFPPPNDDGVIADIELDPRERDEFLQEAMFECIKGLEEQVKAGRISSYGLSSNNIVLPSNHPHHVNLDLVAKMATEAA